MNEACTQHHIKMTKAGYKNKEFVLAKFLKKNVRYSSVVKTFHKFKKTLFQFRRISMKVNLKISILIQNLFMVDVACLE